MIPITASDVMIRVIKTRTELGVANMEADLKTHGTSWDEWMRKGKTENECRAYSIGYLSAMNEIINLFMGAKIKKPKKLTIRKGT